VFMCVFSSAKGVLILLSENSELVKDPLPFQLSVGGRGGGKGWGC
jgi:hypothetical protein